MRWHLVIDRTVWIRLAIRPPHENWNFPWFLEFVFHVIQKWKSFSPFYAGNDFWMQIFNLFLVYFWSIQLTCQFILWHAQIYISTRRMWMQTTNSFVPLFCRAHFVFPILLFNISIKKWKDESSARCWWIRETHKRINWTKTSFSRYRFSAL